MPTARDVLELVNLSPPTNAPRHVRIRLASPTFGRQGDVCSRTLHTSTLLLPLVSGFSNAQWLDALIEVVPRDCLKACSLRLNISLHSSQTLPSEENDVLSHGSSTVFISGSADSLPSILRFPLNFDAHFISTLIRPAPIQMPQATVSFSFSVTSLDSDVEVGAQDVIFDVYLIGIISTGGAA